MTKTKLKTRPIPLPETLGKVLLSLLLTNFFDEKNKSFQQNKGFMKRNSRIPGLKGSVAALTSETDGVEG